jgi:hypothetical protein
MPPPPTALAMRQSASPVTASADKTKPQRDYKLAGSKETPRSSGMRSGLDRHAPVGNGVR